MAFADPALLDDFNRASLGSNYSTPWFCAGAMAIASNQLKSSGTSGDRGSYYNATTYGPDLNISIDVPTLPLGTFNIMVRLDNAGKKCYLIELDKSANLLNIYYVHGTGPTWDELYSGSITFAATNKLGVQLVGHVFTIYKYSSGAWSQVVSYDDTNNYVSAAGYVGVGSFDSSSTNLRLDNLRAERFYPSVTLTPAAATVKGSRVNPAVVLGSLTLTPAAAAVKGASVAPAVVLGSITIVPGIAVVRAVGVDPVVDGSSTFTPAPVTVKVETSVLVIQGSIVITPAIAEVRVVAINPTVTGGEFEIPPLGQGDSPGFIAFMLASAIYAELTREGLADGLEEPSEASASFWSDYLFGS